MLACLFQLVNDIAIYAAICLQDMHDVMGKWSIIIQQVIIAQWCYDAFLIISVIAAVCYVLNDEMHA